MTITVHELKSWPDFWEPVANGTKTFELRFNDRNFRLGDILFLREFDDRKGVYTGRTLKKKVTHILAGIGAGCIAPVRGLHRQYVIMSLSDDE